MSILCYCCGGNRHKRRMRLSYFSFFYYAKILLCIGVGVACANRDIMRGGFVSKCDRASASVGGWWVDGANKLILL